MSYSSEVLADSPILYYRFNDPLASSVLTDSSGNGRHGTKLFLDPTFAIPSSWSQIGSVTGDGGLALGFGDDEVEDEFRSLFVRSGRFATPNLPVLESFTIEYICGGLPRGVRGLEEGNPNNADVAKGAGVLNIRRGLLWEVSYGNGKVGFNSHYHVHGVAPKPILISAHDVYHTAETHFSWPSKAHVVITMDLSVAGLSVVRKWVNGVEQPQPAIVDASTFSHPITFPNVVEPIEFRGGDCFLDEFAIYGTLLSPSRIQARYKSLPTMIGGEGRWTGRGTAIRHVAHNAKLLMQPKIQEFSGPTQVARILWKGGDIRVPPWVYNNFTAYTQRIKAEAETVRTSDMLRVYTAGSRLIAGMERAIPLEPNSVTISATSASPAFVDSYPIPADVMRGKINVSAFYWFTDPVPTETRYRLLVTDLGGHRLAELTNAKMGEIPWAVTGTTSFTFTIPANDPKAVWCQEVRREVQVWRNDRMLWSGPMVRVNNDGVEISVSCMDPSWYFTQRVVGRVPKRNLLQSEDGEPASLSGWTSSYLPRSNTRTGPAYTPTRDNAYSDRASMRLSSSTGGTKNTYSNDDWYNGSRLTVVARKDLDAVLRALMRFTTVPRISVKVYDDDQNNRARSLELAEARCHAVTDYILDTIPQAKVITEPVAYRKPLKDGTDKENRRTVLSYKALNGVKGHKQHVYQRVTLRNPSKNQRKQKVSFTCYVYIENEDGWAAGMRGVEIVRADPKRPHPDPVWRKAGYRKPLESAIYPFGDGFTTGAWVRVVATVVLPNNGRRSQIEVRLFPPNGDALFTEMWLVRDQSMSFRQQEQADIITALVEHAQNPRMGKSDLSIQTNIAKTGIKRTRDYPWDERATIYDLLAEFPTLANGVEWQIVQTPDSRTFTTYYPRMGKDTDVVLAYGSNAVSYEVASDGTLISTSVIIQAPDRDDYTREERSATDDTLTDGVTLERVYEGTPNSPATTWRKQAERGLARYRRPVTMPTLTMHPDYTEELLGRVSVGDRVTTNISDAAQNIDAIQKVRVVEAYLDPNTDTMSYALYPEDINVKVLSGYGANVRYFSQPQNPIVGADGDEPVESDREFRNRSFNDNSWERGRAGVGWVKEATGNLQVRPAHVPATTVPDNHEVWIRKWVNCTGDMVLTLRAADWTYLYVNGNLVGNDHFEGYNRYAKIHHINLRVPSSWLHPSGRQLIAVHSQFDPAIRSSQRMSSVYADVQVRGTYNPDEVS